MRVSASRVYRRPGVRWSPLGCRGIARDVFSVVAMLQFYPACEPDRLVPSLSPPLDHSLMDSTPMYLQDHTCTQVSSKGIYNFAESDYKL